MGVSVYIVTGNIRPAPEAMGWLRSIVTGE